MWKIVLLLILTYTQTASACTWDGVANKCVPGSGEVVVYKHAACKGPDYFAFNSTVQPGYADISSFTYVSGAGSLNDSISCFVVGPKTTFVYYEDANYGGKTATVTNNHEERTYQKSIGRTRWNDVISSVKVFGDKYFK